MLPRYIEAMRPQTKLFCSMNSSGPGFSPQTMRPPRRIAAVPEPGMPSASIGGGLRRQHAVDAALAEALLVARETLGKVVAHERRRDRPAWGDSKPAADRCRP